MYEYSFIHSRRVNLKFGADNENFPIKLGGHRIYNRFFNIKAKNWEGVLKPPFDAPDTYGSIVVSYLIVLFFKKIKIKANMVC